MPKNKDLSELKLSMEQLKQPKPIKVDLTKKKKAMHVLEAPKISAAEQYKIIKAGLNKTGRFEQDIDSKSKSETKLTEVKDLSKPTNNKTGSPDRPSKRQ